MHKIFSFKAINRATDVVVSQDGECMDILNLRPLNGSLSPVPQPMNVTQLFNSYSAIYWHAMPECYICVTGDSRSTIHIYDKAWKQMTPPEGNDFYKRVRNVRRVELLGNIVCCMTMGGIIYLIYDDGCYRLLGNRPEVPSATIKVTSKVQTLVSEDTYAHVVSDDLSAAWSYNEKGYVDQCISALNKDGYYIDRAIFRVALRMFDGSYINCSNIYYVSDETFEDGVGRDANNMVAEAVDNSAALSSYRVSVRGFKVEFSFDASALEPWRNIVVGIDVFSTPSIPGKKVRLLGRREQYEGYEAVGPEELLNAVSTAALFYKVAEFDLQGNAVYTLDDVSPVSLALQQVLDAGEYQSMLTTIDAGCSYVYNNRLHVASLREYFFNGYGADSFCPVSGDRVNAEIVATHTKIKTLLGTFVVEKYMSNVEIGYNGYEPELPALLAYPDARACEISVYVRYNGVVYNKVFPLTPHRFLNMSCYLHRWYSPYTVSVEAQFDNGASAAYVSDDIVLQMFDYRVGNHEVVYDAANERWLFEGSEFPDDRYSAERVFSPPRNVSDGDKLIFGIRRHISSTAFKDINNIPIDVTWNAVAEIPEVTDTPFEMRRNVLKVSAVDNPFYFPAKCTYSPSQSEIVALSGNTTALSQGQFGQFPLYIFCSDGVWAMAVDGSGAMAYLSSHQLSREVCVSARTVCGVGGGVVFVSRQGVMLLVGNEMRKISAPMEGGAIVPVCAGLELFARMASLLSLADCSEQCGFEEYVHGSIAFYDSSHGEVILSNGEWNYYYVYSMETNGWCRRSGKIDGYVRGAQDVMPFVCLNSSTSIMLIPESKAGSNRVMLFTRPQIWGTKLPKRVLQLMLHAYAESPAVCSSGGPLLACYLLCSNDGVHFKLVSGSEKKEKVQDILFPYFPSQSYKYFLFAIIGELGEKSRLTGIEVDVETTWSNRMR